MQSKIRMSVVVGGRVSGSEVKRAGGGRWWSGRAVAAAVAAVTAALSGSSMARAGDLIWDAGQSTDWNTTQANWTGQTWNNANSDYAAFPPDFFGQTITLSEPIIARGIKFGANGMNLQGPGTLTLVRTGVQTLNSTIYGTVDMPAAFVVDPNVTATISGSVISAVGFQKQGTGRLILAGSNSFTGVMPMFVGENPANVPATRGVNVFIGGTVGSLGIGREEVGIVQMAHPQAINSGIDIGFGNGFLDMGAYSLTVNNVRFTGAGDGLEAQVWKNDMNGLTGPSGTGTLTITGEISHTGGPYLSTFSSPLDFAGQVKNIRGSGSGIIFMSPITNGGINLGASYISPIATTFSLGSGITLVANNTFVGPMYINGGTNTILGTNETTDVRVTAGAIQLRTASGSLNAATTIALLSGSTLTLDSGTSHTLPGSGPSYAAGNNNNRLRDDVAITMRDSTFTLNGQAGGATSETIGSLAIPVGRATINVQPVNAVTPGTATLTIANGITMGPRSTIAFGVGNAAGAQLGTTAKVFVTSGLPATVGGILPRMATTADFLYNDPVNGLSRFPNYTSTIPLGGNVSLDVNTTVSATGTVNSLRLNGTSLVTTIGAGQTLNVTSGMMLSTAGTHIVTGTATGTVAFGGTPGVFFGSHTFTSVAMTGSAGIVNHSGSLTLNANMAALGGTVTSNGGTLTIANDSFPGHIHVRTGSLVVTTPMVGGRPPIRIGSPENSLDDYPGNNAAGTLPQFDFSGAGANTVIARDFIISNGGLSSQGQAILGATSFMTRFSPKSDTTAGTQTFTGNFLLDGASFNLQGGGGGNAADSIAAGTAFAGTISGTGSFVMANGRLIFPVGSSIQNAGGVYAGGTGFTARLFFLGSAGEVPLTVIGGNNTSVVYSGAASLPRGVFTIPSNSGTVTLIPTNTTTLPNTLNLDQPLTIAPPNNVTVTLTGSIQGANGGIITSGAGKVIFAGATPNNLTISAGVFSPSDVSPLGVNTTVAQTGTLDFTPSAVLSSPVLLSSGQVISPIAGLITGGTVAGTGSIRVNTTWSGPTQTTPPVGQAVIASKLSGSITLDLAGTNTSSPVTTVLMPTINVTLTNTNDFSGQTRVTNYTLRGVPGVNLSPNSNVLVNGGLLEGAPLYAMTTGSGPGQVQLTGRAGFGAFGVPSTVSLNGGSTIMWGSTAGFNPTSLVLNGPAANQPITFTNNIDLNGAERSIWVVASPNTLAATGTISGVISGVNGGIVKDNFGILVLTGTNTYGGRTVIGSGTLRAVDGVGLPSSSLLVLRTGGTYQPTTAVPFTRAVGSFPGQVQMTGESVGYTGNVTGFSSAAGFDAFTAGSPGTALTIGFGGVGSTVQYTGSGDWGARQLWLNTGVSANGPINWTNSVELGGQSFTVLVGTGSQTGSSSTVTMTGKVQSTTTDGANAVFVKAGPGNLILNNNTAWGTWQGGSIAVTGGVLALAATSAGIAQNINVAGGTFDPRALGTPFLLRSGQTITFTGSTSFPTTPVINPVNTMGGPGMVRFDLLASSITYNWTNTATAAVGQAGVIKGGLGVLNVLQTMSYTGGTYILGGTLRALQGVGLPNSGPLVLSGGGTVAFSTATVWPSILSTGGVFQRGLGTGSGQVSFPAGVPGSGVGFENTNTTAGTPLVIAIGGTNAPSTLTNGTALFSTPSLLFNTPGTQTGGIEFRNTLDLNSAPITLQVGGTSLAATNSVTFTGKIIDSGSGNTVVTKTGGGTLILANTAADAYAWSGGSWVVGIPTPNQTIGGTLAIAAGVPFTQSVTLNGANVAANFEVRGAAPLSLGSNQVITAIGGSSSISGSFTGSGLIRALATTSTGNNRNITGNLLGGVNLTVESTGGTTAFPNTTTVTLTGTVSTSGTFTILGTRGVINFNTPVVSATTPANLVVGSASGGLARFVSTGSTSSYTGLGRLASISVNNATGATVYPTGTVQIAQTNRTTNRASVLVTGSLDLSPNGPNFAGFLDIGNNDVIVENGNLGQLRAGVATWYNNRTPIAQGIGSSVTGAGVGVQMVAVFPNDAGDGTPFYATYDGVSLNSSAVIIKYTNFGDTNIDGVVNATDLVNAIEGFSNGYTGWQNGDFDYNGIVDSVDIGLLLTSLSTPGLTNFGNGQGGEIWGSTGAVPEPTALLVPLAMAPMALGRRRRQK